LDAFGIWAQFGLAGAIAISLGMVVSYVFKLFVKTQSDMVTRLISERNAAHAEIERLHEQIEEKVVPMLVEVSRTLAQVQSVFRDRDTALAVQKELERMKREQHGSS
jgi:hypothetical protein